jgi:hypothetical protein
MFSPSHTTQYRHSKLAIRYDPEDIRGPKHGFEDGCTKKGALISFGTYNMILGRGLENERNKYYLSSYLTCQVMITNVRIKGFRNGTRALTYL